MSATSVATRPLPLSAEVRRQLRRRRTIGIFVVLAVLPLVLLLAFWLGNDDSASGERGFVDLAQESGANLVIFTLFASTSFLLIVIVALFAGDTVPSEASWASLRYLLAAPVRRLGADVFDLIERAVRHLHHDALGGDERLPPLHREAQ